MSLREARIRVLLLVVVGVAAAVWIPSIRFAAIGTVIGVSLAMLVKEARRRRFVKPS
jgi:hypothetical protein